MKIVFINFPLRPWMETRCYPVGIAYVMRAVAEAGYEFDLVDVDARRYDDAELEMLLRGYDVIALGSLVSGYGRIKRICELARTASPAATIVVGNSVASSIPEHLLVNTQADIAVLGEGETTMVKLLKALETGRSLDHVPGLAFNAAGHVMRTPKAKLLDVNELPLPMWERFYMDTYLENSHFLVPKPFPLPRNEIRACSVNTARGCPHRCTFCYHVFKYARYRRRSAENILDEIGWLQKTYGVNSILFSDELSFPNKRALHELVEGIQARKMEFFWLANCRSDMVGEDDIDLLRRAKTVGCIGLGYALESADESILRAMNKKLSVRDFVRQKKALDKACITTYTGLVIGYPQETQETLRKTFDLCYDLDLYPSTGYLLPQPGTAMFEIARKKGLVPDLERFLLRMGDRQDLRYNLTALSNRELQDTVKGHLARIAKKLGLGLSPERLIKMGERVDSREAKCSSE